MVYLIFFLFFITNGTGFILPHRHPLSPLSKNRFASHDILVCPESLEPLKYVTRYYGFLTDKTLRTEIGDKIYPVTGTYIDLTPIENEKPLFELNIRKLVGQNFFQNPIISGIYERGYRQNFERAGFPGPEKEFAEIDEFFTAANASTVFDLSCGPGFMARKLTASGHYQDIIAGDLSPNMLAETRQRFVDAGLSLPTLLRVDAAALPLATGSLGAVHAGAAMHCWPKISQSLREVYRVLKPGGVFYASTFFTLVPMSKYQQENSGFYYFSSEGEITDFLVDAGFGGSTGSVVVRKEGAGCAIIKAVKGDIPEACKKFFPSAQIAKDNSTDITPEKLKEETDVTISIQPEV